MVQRNHKAPAHKRQDEIRQMLKSNHEVTIPQMAQEFGVSEMTIHRDLRMLENNGHLRRTRGGAQPSDKMEFEFDFANRRAINQKAKQAIAQEAMKFIKPGHKIILDTGTTTLELAYLLKDHKDLTVITPSLAVASVLQFSSGVQTILLGGIICQGSPNLTGVVTEKVLDMFMVDIAFQGADGIDLNGEMYNADMRIASVDKKMRTRANKKYILCDSSKIAKTELASNGSLSEVDALITDSKIQSDHIKMLKKTKTKIIAVKI
jgi:DeoR/GlpR family transcriptional regulator of sugar metabolism